MTYQQTTQVPNFIFALLPNLTEAELKVILTVIRQTYGWIDKRTSKRKLKDRISGSQFRLKTGLSKRTITKTLQSLMAKNLLEITDYAGNVLQTATDRQGKTHLYYSLSLVHMPTETSAPKIPALVHKGDHNKTNYTKLKRTKLSRGQSGHISSQLPELKTLFYTNA